jgi:S1-C subfamily serine protease
VVVDVPRGAPLARSGFPPRPGDIIESVNGTRVATVAEVQDALGRNRARTLFGLNRGGQRVECLFEAPGNFGCRAAA